MFVFPAALAPPSPFPAVLMQSVSTSFVAPGIARAAYRIATAAGPLVINVVALDPRDPAIRLRTILADDRLISGGETVSSMALRSGAVAGVNGDYFDIGNTNQPLNLVVQEGVLVRTPSKRYALDVRRDGSVHFERFRFSGTVRYGANQVPLTTLNEWPPEGGASLLSAAYGRPKVMPGVSLQALVPQLPAPAGAATYSVALFDPNSPPSAGTQLLGLGPAALALAPAPASGDVVFLEQHLDPPLEDITTALGGGPLLIKDGLQFDDPNAPAPEERERRFPVAGAATTAAGELLLVAVDGRQPALSVGLTRPEFAALFLGLGASDGMAFDSGGSATLVARVLGDARASVLNAPSDGRERPVADGLFAYSDAPAGLHPHLVVRPATFAALPGARVQLAGAIVDDAGNFVRAATLAPVVAPREPGPRTIAVAERDGGYSADVVERVVARVATLRLSAVPANPDAGAHVVLHAEARDERDEPLYVGDAVQFGADRGTFAAPGIFVAPAGDAAILATAGGAIATLHLRVGRHDQPLALFEPLAAPRWTFSSAPPNLTGALTFSAEPPELRLAFDFTSGERAAYASGAFPLPGEPSVFALDVDGDGSGVAVRAAFLNRFGERQAVTLAAHVDWKGWRRCIVRLPPDLNPPVTLVALYAVPSLGGAPARTRGSVGFRNAALTLPGS
ncbi:MAG TPA: phosphodiester glycosidase family protein [Candidatus Baltobacteraceae bacterium]|nr:phosphodiester glycosidase family protein [Candidatus Baltobacteraceae bacterium]